MRMLAIWCLAMVAALVHSASIATAASDLSELDGTFWRVDHLDGTSEDTSAIVVYISRHTIHVSVPCVKRLYPVSYVSGSFKIKPSAGSSSCRGTRSSGMADVEASLPKIAGYVVKADGLSFLDDQSQSVLALSRIAATGLENKEWSVEQYYDGAKLVPATAESLVTFVNGFIDGSPGCGAFALGDYILSRTRLKASVSLILGGYCPDDLWSRSGTITKALSGERTIERDNQQLVLRDAEGTIQVILRP
jgi:heat shock protein HslJ